MRSIGVIASMAIVSGSMMTSLVGAPAAGAEGPWGLNGTYTATSNGEWAQTNDSYRDAPTVRDIWNISTTCTTSLDCAGSVTSQQGWTASISTRTGVWYARRDIEGWQQCPDGTSAVGHQLFRFYPVGPDSFVDASSTTYVGADETTGDSGACGRNKWRVINMPFKLIKIS